MYHLLLNANVISITLWLLRIAELQSIRIVEIYSLDAIGKEVSYM